MSGLIDTDGNGKVVDQATSGPSARITLANTVNNGATSGGPAAAMQNVVGQVLGTTRYGWVAGPPTTTSRIVKG